MKEAQKTEKEVGIRNIKELDINNFDKIKIKAYWNCLLRTKLNALDISENYHDRIKERNIK